MDEIERRGFLLRCLQSAGVSLLPAGFTSVPALARPAEPVVLPPPHHLEPRYRQPTQFQISLGKIDPANDQFVTERYQALLTPTISSWSQGLRQTPSTTQPIEQALGANFRGFAYQPSASRKLRNHGHGIESSTLSFAPEPTRNSREFIQELRGSLAAFSGILTAEFQITAIERRDAVLKTRIRYELVATGPSFYREQRIGEWSLEWEAALNPGVWRVILWTCTHETRSRASVPVVR